VAMVSDARGAGAAAASGSPGPTVRGVRQTRRASGTERGQILSLSAALVVFLLIVAAMTGTLPSGIQNTLADFAARVYIDVPHSDQDVATGRAGTPTTTPVRGAPSGTADATTTTVIEERGPVPTEAPTTSATPSASTTTAAKPATSTTAPPSTDAPPPTEPPVTATTAPVPSVVIPTTRPACTNPSITYSDAQIQNANKHIVQVTVRFDGDIQHMQAAVAGQSFSSLTRVGQTFVGSVSSFSDVQPGTNVVILACAGTINQQTKAHP